MYVLTNQLPEIIQSILKELSFNKKDIVVNIKEEESLFCASGDGRRGFVVLVNLSTNDYKIMRGSWGGANPFNPNNQVDLNDNYYKIPDNAAVIKGMEGNGVSASVTFSPSNIVKNILPMEFDLSKEELLVLGYFRGYKSSYRKTLLLGKDDMVNKLIEQGYLSKNKAGATSLTLKGKNAAENVRVY
jgi:hypothetical protein